MIVFFLLLPNFSELELTGCANTRIGDSMVRGISGGEKKRVAIGVEMISDPSLVFLVCSIYLYFYYYYGHYY